MFDLCAPMKGCLTSQGRYLFLEGDMKYKDNISKVCISLSLNHVHHSNDFAFFVVVVY